MSSAPLTHLTIPSPLIANASPLTSSVSSSLAAPALTKSTIATSNPLSLAQSPSSLPHPIPTHLPQASVTMLISSSGIPIPPNLTCSALDPPRSTPIPQLLLNTASVKGIRSLAPLRLQSVVLGWFLILPRHYQQLKGGGMFLI